MDCISNRIIKRNFYRGANLGSVFTDAQKESIRRGSFKGLFLGDYWKINNVTWRIVDFDYWINAGDTPCKDSHLLIMPDTALYQGEMNDSDTTSGGYANSKMRKSGLDQAKEMIFNAFGEENVLNHREILSSVITNDHASSGNWYDSTVELPNEIMMYGCYIFSPASSDGTIPYRYTIEKTQLAMTKANPNSINPTNQRIWLRDVASRNSFCMIGREKIPNLLRASSSIGVCPVFGLTGGAA